MKAASTLYRRPDARNRRASVRIVSHVTAELPTCINNSNPFESARLEALKWVNRRAGVTLPDKAWSGQPFDLKDTIGAQPVSAAAVKDHWAIRLDDDDKETPQRTWITEISIWVNREHENQVHFSCRLVCRTLGENPSYPRTVPGIVRQIADNMPATIDHRPLRTTAWRVDNEESIDQLIALLVYPQRQRPVIVVSAAPYGGIPAISVEGLEKLAKTNLLAVAHIVSLGKEASYVLTDRVGEEFSAFNGAVRTFQPGLSLETDQPTAHPLALYETIRNWGEESEFCDFLVERTMQSSLSSRYSNAGVPSLATIHAQLAKEDRQKLRDEGASDSKLLSAALDENEKLEQRLEEQKGEYEELLMTAENERDVALDSLDEAKNRAYSLKARIDYLENERQKRGVISEPEIPSSLDDLKEWANKHLSGRVEILNRGYRAAKKSPLEDCALVYNSLLMLRDHYVPMRLQKQDKRSFLEACQELGIEESASFRGDRFHEEGDAYKVNYDGRERLLERHLKKGNKHDPRYCFRLYFFWHQESGTVVVGSLPSHLDNRMT